MVCFVRFRNTGYAALEVARDACQSRRFRSRVLPPGFPRVRRQRFLVEQQSGVSVFQVYLSRPIGWAVSHAQTTRVSPGVCEVRYVCRGTAGRGERAGSEGFSEVAFSMRVQLGRDDFRPDAASCSEPPGSDAMIFRIPYGTCSGVLGEVLEIGDADSEEDVSRVEGLRCRLCGQAFTRAGKALAMRALPSGRWDECIDDMICYDGPSAVPMLAREVTFARRGMCLLGKAEALLHPEDVIAGAIARKPGERSKENGMVAGDDSCARVLERTLECSRCGLPLGRLAPPPPQCWGDDEGHRGSEAGGLLILKHCLIGDDASDAGIDKGDARPPVFSSVTAVRWLMEEIEHAFLVNRCSRFLLGGAGPSDGIPPPGLSLVLMATHTRVSEDGNEVPRKAFRVAFAARSSETDGKLGDPMGLAARRLQGTGDGDGVSREGRGGEGVQGLGQRNSPREIVLPARELEEVRARLVRSSWMSSATVDLSCSKLDARRYRLSYLH